MTGVLQMSPSGVSPRFRLTFKFLLDLNKELDYYIADRLDQLRAARQLTGFIRDACKLVFSLQEGRTDVLDAMFPHLRPAPSAADDLREQTKVLFEALTAALLQSGAAPAAAPTNEGGPKPLQVNNAAFTPAPSDDDVEDFTLEAKEAAVDEDNRSNWNFMIASAFQVYGNCDSLPVEIIHYGLRTKRIKPQHITKKIA